MRDPYSILGVSRHADQQEIKAAWRTAAKALHPDQNPGDPLAQNRFTEAGRAYELLRDPEKRRRFDEARARAGSSGKEKTFMEQRADRARAEAEARAAAELARKAAEARAAAAAAAVAAQSKSDPGENHESAEDVVAKIFGTRREQAKTDQQQDTQTGREKPVEAESPAAESRSEPAFDVPETTPDDQGAESKSPALNLISYVLKRLTRQVPAPEKAPDLVIDVEVTIEDLLNRLNPAITLPDGKLLSVTLPQDARDGSQVRIEGYGHRLPGMKRGDVLATIRIKPHRWYRHDGHDLLTYIDIDIENAVLGCEVAVETPDGPQKVSIPAWSGSQYKARIAGKGLPRGNGLRGDLVAEVRVLLWDHPDQKVIDLMRSMREGLYL